MDKCVHQGGNLGWRRAKFREAKDRKRAVEVRVYLMGMTGILDAPTLSRQREIA